MDLAGSRIRRTVHPSGLRVLTEHMPGARSATIGFWVGLGSRDEQGEQPEAPASLGSTHFLEHLLFKGTPGRSAHEIAIAFDRIGAEHNALTAKEYTCYYAKVRDADIDDAVAALGDMVTSSLIDAEEFENEREVILEELAMAADDPGDVAQELFFQRVFGAHPLGRPIGGTPETIRRARRDDVVGYYSERYRPNTLVVTAAGAVDHDAIVAGVLAALEGSGLDRWSTGGLASPAPRRSRLSGPRLEGLGDALLERPGGQVNLLLGGEGLPQGDERRFAFGLMNSVLGGGMSSRLFQEIREKRGLAYSTYAFGASYSDAGLFGMYAGCAPQKAGQVIELLRSELAALAADGITDEERDRVLGQIAGSSALALEDSETRMGRLARSELGTGELIGLDESVRRFHEVTQDEVREVAAMLAARPMTLVAVGEVGAAGLAGERVSSLDASGPAALPPESAAEPQAAGIAPPQGGPATP